MATKSPNTPTPFKPFKKGTPIQFVSGGRGGSTTHTGTVVAFVEAGADPVLPKKLESFKTVSNRARYLVAISETEHRYANAKSATALASASA